MRRTTARLPIAALAALITAALAGCGNPTAGGSGSGPLPEASADMDLKGVTLTVWQSNTLQAGYKTLFEEFEKETGARIRSEVFPDPYESNLLTKWTTGTRPDLMVFQSTASYLQRLNPKKNLYDLSGQDFVAKQRFGLADSASVYDGRNYGLTLEPPSVFGLWYNKEVLAASGLKPPTNLAGLHTVCAALKRKNPGVAPLYDAGGDQWTTQILPFMLWADAMKGGLQDGLNTNKARWTDPAVVDSLKAYKKLVADGCFNKNLRTGTYAEQEELFAAGKVAMIPQGTWVSADFVKSVGVERMNKSMGWQALSASTPTAAYATTFSVQMPRTGDRKREQAALAFLKFASGPAYQKFVDVQKQAPTLDGFTTPAEVPEATGAAYAALQGGTDSAPQLFAADFGPFPTYMSKLINGTSSPEQVAGDLQAAWTKSAKAVGLPGF
ncbi:extracellular solute-binding protein [Streptomyces sp. NPDC051940]|uniref:ABC transporter substrate-binding protein n=1 Tax=Streptomyces sp. NPDC051940 TaxID=3155675 RepID=UPI00343050BD